MSNKTQLQTNNTDLDALIARVNAAKDTASSLPDAGSGGGSIETCTVTVNVPEGMSYLCASTMSNGQLNPYVFNGRGSTEEHSLVIENVICGTAIVIYAQVMPAIVTFSNGGELINQGNGYFTLKAPTEAGVSTTVDIYTDPDW